MRFLMAAVALLLASPGLAQNEDLGTAPPVGGEVETVPTQGDGDDDGGLSVNVSFEGSLDDLQLAIPAFAAERDVATAANARGTAAQGAELARDLRAAEIGQTSVVEIAQHAGEADVELAARDALNRQLELKIAHWRVSRSRRASSA